MKNIEVFKNDCYKINLINTTNNPLLKSINHVFILTMENSNNLKSRQPELFELGKNTYIQYNKGYQNCNKNVKINNTNLDIVDAYKNICEFNINNNENIIILEDDAFIINFDKKIYNEINDFIQNNNFDIYSFASGGLFNKFGNTNHKKILFRGLSYNNNIILPFWGLQAAIWSAKTRAKIINLNYDVIINNYNIDTNLIYNNNLNVYIYKQPLIVQAFNMTENSKNWDPTFGYGYNFLKINKENLNNLNKGWNKLYFYNFNIIYIILIIIILIILIICFANNLFH